MKNYVPDIVATVVLGLLVAFVVYCIAFAPTRASIVQDAREASVMITDGNGRGSGVVITTDGRIITAGHVCIGADEEKLEVKTWNDETVKAEVLWVSPYADLCLIQAKQPYRIRVVGQPEPTPFTWTPAPLAAAVPAVGDAAFHVGNYLPGLVSFGTIGGPETGWDERPALSYIGMAGPGSSGGGVFNVGGELVGLIYSGPEIVVPVMDRMGMNNVRIPRGLAHVIPVADIVYLLVR